jgi:EpsI family protein
LTRILRTAIVALAAMACASVGALALRPRPNGDAVPAVQLEQLIPQRFGNWRVVPAGVQVINPQTQQLLDKLYSQTLLRTYVNDRGERIMLSIAFGDDQRGGLQAHMPEVCYPAQGFSLVGARQRGEVSTVGGALPVQRLHARLASREEPISYWFTFGAQTLASDSPWEKRLIEFRFGLSGVVPNGILVRVSSIGSDASAAYVNHDAFIRDLIASMSLADRSRLVGGIG